MNFDLVIHDGTLVLPNENLVADLGISESKIAEIGKNLIGARNIDATGKLVLPGAVDPHVHLDMPVGATRSSDDWASGTIAAACGGTTSIIDFIEPEPGQPVLQALISREMEANGKAAIDYGLHMTVRDGLAETIAQLPGVIAHGCPSFKTYLTYAGFKLDDAAMLKVLESVGTLGGLTLVHAENDAIIEHITHQLVSARKTNPAYHPVSRPASAESEAIHRVLTFAKVAHASIYIVHISTADGVEELARAQGNGVIAFGETCPQYLLLTEAEYKRPDFEGAKFVCSPPLRTEFDNKQLWKALSEDTLQSVGTDHCPFNYFGQKDLGQDVFTKIPSGLPGIESRLALLYTFGVRAGRISVNQWVDLCSTNPARIFGLYPQKGSLLPGSDADIVVFDPNRKVVLSSTMLHEHVDYTPYQGFQLHGYPVMTLLRGDVISEEGKFTGQLGSGQFMPRWVEDLWSNKNIRESQI